jgi:hypothetical protein
MRKMRDLKLASDEAMKYARTHCCHLLPQFKGIPFLFQFAAPALLSFQVFEQLVPKHKSFTKLAL